MASLALDSKSACENLQVKIADAAFATLVECDRLRHLLAVIDEAASEDRPMTETQALLRIETFSQMANGLVARIEAHASTISHSEAELRLRI